jgi:hypothetical protein
MQLHLPTQLTCRCPRSDGAHQPFVLAPDPVDSGSWTERDLLFMHVGGPPPGAAQIDHLEAIREKLSRKVEGSSGY